MARITENPKFVGGAILFSLGLGVYLHGPQFWREITAPPPKPLIFSPPPEEDGEELKFYRMVPKNLPDKWGELLISTNSTGTMFEEVPKSTGSKNQTVLPDLKPGWHLSSIYLSPKDRVAVVSGTMVREGDVLEPFTVKSVEEDRVVFAHPLGERSMVLGQRIPVGDSGVRAATDKTGMTNAITKGMQAIKKLLPGQTEGETPSDSKASSRPNSP